MTTAKTVEEYIATQPDEVRPVLKRLRTVLKKALPKSEELISYAIPAFRLSGRVGLYFAGWKEHVSVYPASDAIVASLGKELDPYLVSKTLKFPLSKTLPVHLIQRVAKARAAELSELTPPKQRAARKPSGTPKRPARPARRTSRRG